MASPILQKLTPKSPIAFTQTLTKSFSVGFATQTPKKSPQNYLNPNNVSKSNVTQTSPETFLSPRLVNTVFANGRKSDGGTTPSIAIGPSPDSPMLVCNFATTKACNALVQSPCRMENYKRQRRRLYHQDSAEDVCSSIGSAPGSANSYQLTPKIGKGGFGSVFVGKYDGKIVAIKQLHSSQKESVKGESLCAELNAFKLNHPNIVKIFTFTCSGSVIQIVSEYVGRKNLQKLLNESEESLDVDRRRRFCTEISAALRFCHDNRVLHLDVKPANILITDATDICKLADFGCSRCLPQDADALPVTPCFSSSSPAGTLIYKSPELLRGLPATTKCDVYSYGYVVWQIVTRQQPFENLNPHTIVFCVVAKHLRPKHNVLDERSQIDKGLLKLAEICWQNNPDERPSFENICIQLENLYSD